MGSLIKRWNLGLVAALLLVATLVGGGLFLAALLDRNYSERIPVTQGPALEPPVPEVTGTTADDSLPDMTNLTTDEIQRVVQDRMLATMGTDTTRSFDVLATVHPDRSVTITETIVQVFRTDRHGIERLIPLKTNLGTNLMRSLEVSASRGTPGDVSVRDVTDGVRIRIGDPDTTVTGAHAYRLSYVLENLVSIENGQAVVRLDAISDWDQRVDTLTYRVSAPGSPTMVRCFVGEFRSTESCGSAALTENGGTFSTGRLLEPGEGFTAEVTYPLDAFPLRATVTPVRGPIGVAIVMWAVLYASVAAGFVITVVRARRSRALAASYVALTFDGLTSPALPDRMERGPLAADVLIANPQADAPLEFVPPLNLDPASMLRLRDTVTVDVPLLLAATLVDLAADGMVDLERVDHDSWTVRRHDRQPRPVREYEEVLLHALLGDTRERELGEATGGVGDALDRFMSALDNHLVGLNLIAPGKMTFSATKNPAGCAATGMLAGLLLAFSGVGFAVLRSAAGTVLSACVVGGVLAAVVIVMAVYRERSRLMRYTKRGLGTVLRITGFERFFRDSEAIHARAAGNMNLYREYMGYAVALGHVDEWVGAMPTEVSTALVGAVPVAALADVAFHPLWLASSRRYTAAHTVKSRSSFSGGGGFSGGGFSGGGGGGGGGGSW
ncbi:MAG: DUF2207 domain-containing protein [Actinobacteria bacterium]|uniref:Unannotated protein n=2 Tax=freshwater metagenome TaxID=449393 RepID=A0A6J6TTR7_9ZZZZ|nr:DUF2207 domain-containing protein [Actinomycetota bacterium]MTB07359.1 DUF2207 domain-containing protein [Actinomycetota bacterium]